MYGIALPAIRQQTIGRVGFASRRHKFTLLRNEGKKGRKITRDAARGSNVSNELENTGGRNLRIGMDLLRKGHTRSSQSRPFCATCAPNYHHTGDKPFLRKNVTSP
jgi:hypothetical protein